MANGLLCGAMFGVMWAFSQTHLRLIGMAPNAQQVAQFGKESDYKYTPIIPWKTVSSIFPGEKHVTEKLRDGDALTEAEKATDEARLWEYRTAAIAAMTVQPAKSSKKYNSKEANIEEFENMMKARKLSEEAQNRLAWYVEEVKGMRKNGKYY